MRIKRSKPPTRKKPFLLLEVFISMMLVLLILGPLVSPLGKMRKQEAKRVQRMEQERSARIAIASLKGRLYAHNTHSWKELKAGVSGSLDAIASGRKTYLATYTLALEEKPHNKLSAKTEYLLMRCTIGLQEGSGGDLSTFIFPLLLENREA